MGDLARYLSQQPRIVELERQLVLQKRLTSRYRGLWRLATGQHETPTDRARKAIRASKANGFSCSVSQECRRIAEEVGLTAQAVRTLWYAKTSQKS